MPNHALGSQAQQPHDGSRIRVCLIHPYSVIRTSLRILIDSWPEYQVTAEAESPADAIELLKSDGADVVVLEQNLKENENLTFIPELLSSVGEVRVVMLTDEVDSMVYQRAIRMGVHGLVTGSAKAECLRKAIAKVHEGELWLHRSMTAKVLGDLCRSQKAEERDPELAKFEALTVREREVASLVCNGLKNAEIGNRLFVAEATVRHHLTSIFGKLRVSSRYELLTFLLRKRLLDPGN